MAYTTDVNSEIIQFLSRAGTRLEEISQTIAEKVMRDKPTTNYQHLLDEGRDIIDFMESLDNNYNDWTEDDIQDLIHSIDAEYNLRDYPYINRGRVNQSINFS